VSLSHLRLENFQCWEDLAVALDPRCTTFMGSTDRGKSAVLRALRWLCQNRPTGAAFIERGKTRCRVTLRVDGKRVSRHKGKRNVCYVDTKKFVAFGNELPAEITALLNVSDLNFQGQHDSPFLLSETPGEAARRLNRVVSLDLIDAALKRVATRVRRAGVVFDETRTRFREARRQRDRLAWVPDYLDKLRKIEKLENAVSTHRVRATALAALLADVSNIERQRERAGGVILAAQKALRVADQICARSDQIRTLSRVTCDLRDAGLTRQRLQTEAIEIQTQLEEVHTCPACGQPIKSSPSSVPTST
jgi:exonuclease SbcC